jgi:hypothetical protein
VIETEKLQTESMELPSLGYVPDPDAIVDLEQTMENFKRDVVRCSELADDSSLEFAIAVAANTYRWARFWEVRHPDPMIRAGCAANLAEAAPLRASVRGKAERMIAKHRGLNG